MLVKIGRCPSKNDVAYKVSVKIGRCRSGIYVWVGAVPVQKGRCLCGAGPKRTVPMWCRSQKFGADLCRSRIIGAGRYRRPEVGAGQIYLVPYRGLWSNVCAHWCPLVPIGALWCPSVSKKWQNRKNCCIIIIKI